MAADQEMKIRFAEALIANDGNAFEAALSIVGDTGEALQIAQNWPNDSEVKQAKIDLIEKNGLRPYLPTKDQQAKDIYDMAKDQKLDAEYRLKAHRLYAEIMGNIDKPNPNSNVVNFQTVMIVKSHGDDVDWEKKAIEQQRTLILTAGNDASATAN